MPDGLGIGIGIGNGIDALRKILIDREMRKLSAAQQQTENQQKTRSLDLQQQQIEESAAARKAQAEDLQRQRDAGTLQQTIDNAAPQQSLTDAVTPFLGGENPQAMTLIRGLKKTTPNIWPQEGPIGKVDYLNPKEAPRPATPPHEQTRAIQTVDAHGKPVIQIVPDIAGSEFPDQPKQQSAGAAQSEVDRSYALHLGKIDTLKKPIQDRAERLTRLADTLNSGSPVADSVIAPELITAMAGGLGSGVRITQSEIESVVKGRNNWQNLSAALDKWNLDPNHAYVFTPEQRQQMTALLSHVSGRVNAAMDAFDEAGTSLSQAKSADEHKKIYNDLKLKLSAFAQGKGGGTQAPSATVTVTRDANGKLIVKRGGG